MKKIFILYAIFLVAISACTQTVSIMTFNVKNLFDDRDDGSEYSEYLVAKGKWNTRKFHAKMQGIASLIKEAMPYGPDILALQEVENANALNRLNQDYLKDLDYQYAVLVPSGRNPTNVAVLSRYPVTGVRAHSLLPGAYLHETRYILEVTLLCGREELILFNNHWKSRREKTKESELCRKMAASLVSERVKTIQKTGGSRNILILGDFNENEVTFGKAGEKFYDPWCELKEEDRASYYYRGRPCTYDHMLLSAVFFESRGFFYRRGSFRVVKPVPFPVSDHYPLVIILENPGNSG
ncbi:MAG: endonuclease/exonuclease/phosphatase family protein [Spirochaetales bacterium]|nr:endonuclease/exonuclease/phosphatase family protein [Spirochaetales bacterium]